MWLRSNRAILFITIVTALTLTGCQNSTDNRGNAQKISATNINFDDCTDHVKSSIKNTPGANRKLTFNCGRLAVPANHDDPDGSTINLFIVRVRSAEQEHRIGSLLINPGGPGASGAMAAVALSLQMPEDLLSRFDIVGFDPRGVALSDPIECISDSLTDQLSAADPDASNQTQFNAQKSLLQQAKSDCRSAYGAKLDNFNTVQTAKDMDRIRAALGDKKLSYLGFSYGTLLGATYAQLFPQNIRAMALDGAVDPSEDIITSTENQAAAFENAFNEFSADCRSRGSQCPIGPDARKTVMQIIQTARETPIVSSNSQEKRKATAGNVILAVSAALYSRTEWDSLANALAAAKNGDAKQIFVLSDSYDQRAENGEHENILDANLTINCNDWTGTITDATIQQKLADWRVEYPLFGTSSALSLLSCQDWPGKPTAIPTIHPQGAPPILVVGTTGDPATPYASAQALTKQLGSGMLLTWNGDGHTAYPQTQCILNAVDNYLVDLTNPPTGKTCPPQ